MPTNFDFLLGDPQFEPFAEAAVSAERVFPISPALCATACRTALEFAVKWVYSVDGSLVKPYEDKLVTLTSTEDFKDLLPSGMSDKLDYLRRVETTPHTTPRGLVVTRQCWRCKTCTAFWISWPIAMVRTIPR